MTFIDFDRCVLNYICDNCGYILWFYDDGREYVERLYNERQIGTQPLEEDYETSKANEDECPICFSKRDVNDKECNNCGHKFF
ncbi:hypothetical protein [Acetivibrio clariflavus]|uniref:hypothetical protein n=1 Tax=Acetivibrio clariflavus TaxID=288965 RepID=UPI000319A82F|nr:hypothetical protein [Acetivibrio clariflavus]